MKKKLAYLPTLLVLATIVFEMSSDLYLPSMPEMALFFSVPDHQVVLTISLYMIGFSVMGLVGGSLSDKYGRRPIYLGGLSLFALASLGCLFAPDIQTLTTLRLIQGMGAGISYVISTAMLKDSYSDEQCSRLFSLMGMAIAISPTVAPILGSYISALWGWQMNFTLISIGAFLIWGISQLFIMETVSPDKLQQLNLKKSFKTYLDLFTSLPVIGNSLISGMTYGSLWAWIALAPFYFIDTLGISTQDYAIYAAVSPISYMIGALINQKLVARLGLSKMLRIGLTVTVLGSALLNGIVYFYANSISLIVAALIIFCIGLAPVFSNAATRSLNVPTHQLGAASAVLALVEMVLAGLYSYGVSWFNNETLYPATITMFLSSIGCVALYWIIRHNKNYQTIEEILK
jgi:DHA1 family bicyclomycin/chloramphenicol resistance-like MFS transporter